MMSLSPLPSTPTLSLPPCLIWFAGTVVEPELELPFELEPPHAAKPSPASVAPPAASA